MENYEKLYKEALEIARDLHDNHLLGQPQTWMTCEKIFPELRESEDKRIRKEILQLVSISGNGNQYEEIKDWLEKQGEQTPFDYENATIQQKDYALPPQSERKSLRQVLNDMKNDVDYFVKYAEAYVKEQEQKQKVQPKFKIGDIIRFKGNETLKGEAETHKIVSYDNELYVFADGTTDLFSEQDLYELVEQKPESGYVDCTEHPEWYGMPSKEQTLAWSEEDEYTVNDLSDVLYNATSITDDTAKEYTDWLKSLKDRVQPQPRQEWSEEDKEMIRHIRCYLNEYGNWLSDKNEEKSKSIYKACDWLESLKPNHWKPSEEQLRAIIDSAQGLYQCKEKEVLLDLYEQLKNL